MSEFARMVDARRIDAAPYRLDADEAERAALAKRFGLVAIHRLEALFELEPAGNGVAANGTMEADVVQACAISGEDLPVEVRETLGLRFVPEQGDASEEEIELDPGELDEIPFSGTQFDLGEAVAQSLALAIDPYATGSNAATVRKEAGLLDEDSAGPFAALKGLRDQ